MLRTRTFAVIFFTMVMSAACPALATSVTYESFEINMGVWTSAGVARTTSLVSHSGASVARSPAAGAHAIAALPPTPAGMFSIWMFDDMAGCRTLQPALGNGEKVQFALVGDGTIGSALGVGINTVEAGECTYTLRHNGVETPTMVPRSLGWNEWRITWNAGTSLAMVHVNGAPLAVLPYTSFVNQAAFGSFWGLSTTSTDYDDAVIAVA